MLYRHYINAQKGSWHLSTLKTTRDTTGTRNLKNISVCVEGGGVRCGDPMHSRSKLQTNDRGIETVVEVVYESSRQKVWLRREKAKNIKDENGRHHEIWDNCKLDTQLRILPDCNHIVWCLEDISKTAVWLISCMDDEWVNAWWKTTCNMKNGVGGRVGEWWKT